MRNTEQEPQISKYLAETKFQSPAVAAVTKAPRVPDDQAVQIRKAIDADPESLQEFAGRYQLVSCPANKYAISVADLCVWRGATTRNSPAIARSRNAARREKTQRNGVVICGTGH